MSSRPRLAIISAVWPFPGASGQQQRVSYKLHALREHFHLTFITFAPSNQKQEVSDKLRHLTDDAIVAPSRYAQSDVSKLLHRLRGSLYTTRTSLKFSNYHIGRVEFPPQRLASLLQKHTFDCALFEYWHAVDSVQACHDAHLPCVLDMHNILWQSYSRQLRAKPWLPAPYRRHAVRNYRAREETAWSLFDALITINAAEHSYVQRRLPEKQLFYAPMGIDLQKWPYSWQPAQPPRIAYYGGLGSPHNQRDALQCYEEIMPTVWAHFPDVELWIVGSRPPATIQALAEQDSRVTVTGFVERVQDVLQTMTAVLCPWTGKYGFRSRLIEVMALGIPVVTTPDAVYGMGLEHEQGLLLAADPVELAEQVIWLLGDSSFTQQHSQLARYQVEQKYSFKNTYQRLATDLHRWLCNSGSQHRWTS